uniref:Serine carboxypeptidase lysosomal cathepsin a n=1 Tax=Rhipicephalus zambeziensis TaxID=60191 RepID=A0A224Z4A1_9ACAR
MISASVWTLLIIAAGHHYVLGSEPSDGPSESEQVSDSPQPQLLPDTNALFLTPLIDDCKYHEAREQSRVPDFLQVNVTAHSGYITVNRTAGSYFFFVLTEVEGNSSTAPLLLWTQGGPGLSSLFGLFLENGPWAVEMYSNLTPYARPRMNTLQKNMSVLYVDVPVGAGFSFTNDSQNGYPKSLEDIVEHMVEFLQQFLMVFSEYRGRDFYLGGESYGARYSVAVAEQLLKDPKNVTLKYRGVISGSGFLGPVLDIAESSSFLYQMSMVNESGRDTFKKQFELMKALAANQSTVQSALYLLISTIFTNPDTPTLFQNVTYFNDHASPMFTERPLIMYACVKFLNSSTFKNLIHVGETNFQYNNKLLLRSFASDWLRDINSMVETVLNKSSMLFYIGQLDTLFPSVNQQTYLETLKWVHAAEYNRTPRELWSKPGAYGGDAYIKKVDNFTQAVVLGMSHYSSAEKPDEVYYLINEFVAGLSSSPKDEEAKGRVQAPTAQ